MYTIEDIVEYCKQNKCNCCPLNRGSAFKCEFKQKPVYWDSDKIKKLNIKRHNVKTCSIIGCQQCRKAPDAL